MFETFVRDLADLREGEEVALVLRDLRPGRKKYLARHVVAVVSKAPAPEAVPLRARSMVGNVFRGERYVRIVRALPQRLPGTPYTDAFEALREAFEQSVSRV